MLLSKCRRFVGSNMCSVSKHTIFEYFQGKIAWWKKVELNFSPKVSSHNSFLVLHLSVMLLDMRFGISMCRPETFTIPGLTHTCGISSHYRGPGIVGYQSPHSSSVPFDWIVECGLIFPSHQVFLLGFSYPLSSTSRHRSVSRSA